MTHFFARPSARGAIAAAALSLTLFGAAPAFADTGSDPVSAEEVLAANGGGLTIDAGPAYAGWDVVVSSQLPASIGSADHEAAQKVSLDASGSGHVVNLAGPANLYFSSPSGVRLDDGDKPHANVAIYRGEDVAYSVDPVTHTAVVEGEIPTVVAPELSSYKRTIIPFTSANVSPSSYERGTPFDLSFSGVFGYTSGDLDGRATSVLIYSDPVTLGNQTVAGDTVTQTIPAEYTTDPHTVALMDSYGRILAVATLDGGAEAETTAAPAANPAATPADSAPAVQTASAPAAEQPKAEAHLASTGVEASGIALVAGGLLVAGAVGLVLARRRRTAV